MESSKENNSKKIFVLGANSDVAKEAIKLYIKQGHTVIAASRSTKKLEAFAQQQDFNKKHSLFNILIPLLLIRIINIIATDTINTKLEKIVGLSSLSEVRGRKSNFIYASTKSAFTQYFAGLRQYLFQETYK